MLFLRPVRLLQQRVLLLLLRLLLLLYEMLLLLRFLLPPVALPLPHPLSPSPPPHSHSHGLGEGRYTDKIKPVVTTGDVLREEYRFIRTDKDDEIDKGILFREGSNGPVCLYCGCGLH
jgi:hypothetical protein